MTSLFPQFSTDTFASTDSLDTVAVPRQLRRKATFLGEGDVFFLERVMKRKGIFWSDTKYCFLTEHVVGLICCNSGRLSRCCLIEDVVELIVDDAHMALGVRIGDRPFRARKHRFGAPSSLFYEMPVDMLLLTESRDAYMGFINAMSVLYYAQTSGTLPVRHRASRERFSSILRIAPDGRRIKAIGFPRARRPATAEQTTKQQATEGSLADTQSSVLLGNPLIAN